jgi:3-oxoacyl-[acyl-carrier-protein] synthase-3
MGGDFFKDWCGGSILSTELTNHKNNIIQDGKTVFKYAVTNMADSSELIWKEIIWQRCRLAEPGQTSIIILTANRMNLEDSKVLMNIEKYGNTCFNTLP